MNDTDAQTVKPDAMNAAAVLLLQQMLDEIVSGTVLVTKLGGEDSEEDWSLNVSLLRNAPGTPKAPVEKPASSAIYKKCPMCSQQTLHVEGRACANCEFAED